MISIAMTTYNGEKYIREQINSILGQSYKDFELIICDDCSNDSTWNILEEYEQKDKRIHCYLNSTNIGFKKNFEKAITLTNGKYIALADQDDIWLSNHLEVLLNHIGNYLLVCTKSKNINAFGINIRMKTKKKILDLNADRNNLLYRLLLFDNYVQGCTIMFDRSLIDDFIPIPEEVKYHDYWLGIITAMYKKIYFINKITVLYRRHNLNVTSEYHSRKEFFEKKIIMRHRMLNCFINGFSYKMTEEQLNMCKKIFQYQLYQINNIFFIKRLFFLFINYIKIYQDKSIILFLPRLIFNTFILSTISKIEVIDN
jgi:glycosyltransferase involved in cell wall biosynthesis